MRAFTVFVDPIRPIDIDRTASSEPGPWSQWSDCTKWCGKGVRIRKRTHDEPDKRTERENCESMGSTLTLFRSILNNSLERLQTRSVSRSRKNLKHLRNQRIHQHTEITLKIQLISAVDPCFKGEDLKCALALGVPAVVVLLVTLSIYLICRYV